MTQNMMNSKKQVNTSSKYKGVSFVKSRNKWIASICVDGIDKNLGRYNTEAEAVKARREAEKKYFGVFAGS